MKTVIVYYSMGGNTAYAAGKIAELTGADLLEIKPVKQYPSSGIKKFLWGGKSAVMAEEPALLPYHFDAGAYERVIFGFPVWAGNVTPPIRTFIREQGAGLTDKKVAAFACQSGSGAEKAFGKLASCLNVPALTDTMVLIDPKEKPDEANERKIMDFCRKLG